MYNVTKRMTDGPLAGMTIVQRTSVAFQVDEAITRGPWTGSGYVVVAVEAIV